MVSKEYSLQNFWILVISLLFGVVFYSYIQKQTGFTYTDELNIFLLVTIWIYRGYKRKKVVQELFLFCVVALFYLVYSLLLPNNITKAIWMDFFIQIKPFLAFYCVLFMNFNISEKHYRKLRYLCILLAILLLPVGLLGIGGSGIMNQFTQRERYATMLIAIGSTYFLCSDKTKRDIYITAFIYSIGLFSTRAKMFGFFLFFLFYMVFANTVKIKKFFTIKNIILLLIAIVAVILIAWDKIYLYFVYGGLSSGDDLMARPALYVGAFRILQDYPIFGCGFGSYASYAAELYYSPLYLRYHLTDYYDIAHEMFLSDTYFPVMAQFGIVGITLFVLFWRKRVLQGSAMTRLSGNPYAFKMTIVILVFFIIESIADSTFTTNRGIYMMMLLALFIKDKRKSGANSKKSIHIIL